MNDRLPTTHLPLMSPIPPEVALDRNLSNGAKLLFRLIMGGEYIINDDEMFLFDELCDTNYLEKYKHYKVPEGNPNKNY